MGIVIQTGHCDCGETHVRSTPKAPKQDQALQLTRLPLRFLLLRSYTAGTLPSVSPTLRSSTTCSAVFPLFSPCWMASGFSTWGCGTCGCARRSHEARRCIIIIMRSFCRCSTTLSEGSQQSDGQGALDGQGVEVREEELNISSVDRGQLAQHSPCDLA